MDEINRIVAFAVKKDVELYTDMPSGWKRIAGALTAPCGSVWICNGESRFSGNRRKPLLIKQNPTQRTLDKKAAKPRHARSNPLQRPLGKNWRK